MNIIRAYESALGMEIRAGIVIILDVNRNARFIRKNPAFLVQPTPEHARNFCSLEIIHTSQGVFDILNERLAG